jgi:hypothetical protein
MGAWGMGAWAGWWGGRWERGRDGEPAGWCIAIYARRERCWVRAAAASAPGARAGARRTCPAASTPRPAGWGPIWPAAACRDAPRPGGGGGGRRGPWGRAGCLAGCCRRARRWQASGRRVAMLRNTPPPPHLVRLAAAGDLHRDDGLPGAHGSYVEPEGAARARGVQLHPAGARRAPRFRARRVQACSGRGDVILDGAGVRACARAADRCACEPSHAPAPDAAAPQPAVRHRRGPRGRALGAALSRGLGAREAAAPARAKARRRRRRRLRERAAPGARRRAAAARELLLHEAGHAAAPPRAARGPRGGRHRAEALSRVSSLLSSTSRCFVTGELNKQRQAIETALADSGDLRAIHRSRGCPLSA